MPGFIARALFTLALFFTTLVFEIILAMAIFVYLRLNAPGLFDTLQGVAFNVLGVIRDSVSSYAPETAIQVNSGVLGELSANAMLLLMLGLFASGVIRVFIWMIRSMATRRSA